LKSKMKILIASSIMLISSILSFGSSNLNKCHLSDSFKEENAISSLNMNVGEREIKTIDKQRINALFKILDNSRYTRLNPQRYELKLEVICWFYAGEHQKLFIYENGDYIYINGACYMPDNRDLKSQIEDWITTQSKIRNTDNKTCTIVG